MTRIQSDFICLWCGQPTDDNQSPEHVIPANIGGQDTLPKGDVCTNCNFKLGDKVDRCMRMHPRMAVAYQQDDSIRGTKRSGKRKQNQKEKKKQIDGLGGSKIYRNDKGDESIVNANLLDTSVGFLRAWHKCVANILCKAKGSKFVRESSQELVEFVKTGKDPMNWSYAISFASFFGFRAPPQGFSIGPKDVSNSGSSGKWSFVCGMIHTSGIWIGSTNPGGMSKSNIELASAKITEFNNYHEWSHYFGMRLESQEQIGDLKFYWAKPEIEGTPSEEDIFYILTKCKVCGQTNPTGMVVRKDQVLRGNRNKMVAHPKNTWNRYSKKDLIHQGLNVANMSEESMKGFLNNPIMVPEENDIKKWNMRNCTVSCINCGEVITWDAKDAFL